MSSHKEDVQKVLILYFLSFDPILAKLADKYPIVLSADLSQVPYSFTNYTNQNWYEEFTLAELENFRQLGACTVGNSQYGQVPGIETIILYKFFLLQFSCNASLAWARRLHDESFMYFMSRLRLNLDWKSNLIILREYV